MLKRLQVGSSTVIPHQPKTSCDRQRGTCSTGALVRKYARDTGALFYSEHNDAWTALVVTKRTAETR